MDDRVQRIRSLIEQDIDTYYRLMGEDFSEDFGRALLGYVCTAHLDAGAFSVTTLLGLSELEKKLSKPGKKVKLNNTCECLAEIKYLSDNGHKEELEELKKYADRLMSHNV